ncbi:hypothetical protein LLEC1_02832 [Akanthomyces lecanii]|uniref:BZIP domain-containing protein n=1 Tax=Cordyceps confragosa TaxID=2714763 RepID=A0A179I4V7_CORDF|nr:hypothetical protein LLEC1_02832 [Akanthomyces lecanii]
MNSSESFSAELPKQPESRQQLGLAQEASHNLRQWDQHSAQAHAVPASSSSSEGHIGNLSRSAWGDEAGGGGALEPFFLPEQFANLQDPSSWWSPPDINHDALFDNSPELGDLDWTLGEELQQAITTAAALTSNVPDLPVLAPAPMIPPSDWSGFGVFDSNPPTVSSTGSSGAFSAHPTPATSTTAAIVYPGTGGRRKHVDPEVALKRQRNKVAAQKYRQKKLDRIAELEVEVTDVKRERDELRIQLAKQEAETAALREMLKLANPGMLVES